MRRGAAWAFFLLILACGGGREEAADGGLQGKLVLTGSSTVAPLAAEIGRRFEELHPGVRVDVQTGGSSRGIADARSGVADFGMASRELADEEYDLRAFPLALDVVGLIARADNPVDGLTAGEVVSVYRGELDNWRDLGGRDAAITVVSKASGRATLEVFLEHFGLEESQIRADIVIGDNQQGIKTVLGDPDAIAYVSIGAAEWEIEHGAELKLLRLEGASAEPGGRLPMTRPLQLVTKEEPTGLARAFLDFATSPAVTDLVEAQLFVPLADS